MRRVSRRGERSFEHAEREAGDGAHDRRFNAGDWEGVAQLIAADGVWVPDSRVGEEPVRGRDRMIEFIRDRAEMFDDYRVEPERFEENEGQVVALIRVVGRGSASGAGFDIRIGHVWVLRDGLIVRGEGYGDRERALEAIGVRAGRKAGY